MSDKYDRAEEYLQAHPSEIFAAWQHGDHPAHCLFASVDVECCTSDYQCLTQIKGSKYSYACTSELTEAIRNDPRIPFSADRITLESLPVMKEWQRKIDAVLGRAGGE